MQSTDWKTTTCCALPHVDHHVTTRGFGLITLVSLVVANMIGAGVFTTSGFALADLGTPDRVMGAWLVGGVLACCGAISYGALVRRMTDSGGEYLFLSTAVHPAAGFIAGWVSLLAGFTGAIAFAASALEAYALPAAIRPDWCPEDALAVTVIVIAGVVHARSISVGVLGQNVLVFIKLALIVCIAVYGVGAIPADTWSRDFGSAIAPVFEWSAFAVSVMWISLSYSGFNAAVYVAGEAADAKRNVPRALLVGTVLVTVLYLLLNALFVYGAPSAIVGREDVAARALTSLGGETLGVATRVLIVLALATSVSSMILAGPRVYARMAADGVLPELFRMHDGAPGRAVALQVVLAVVVVVLSRLQDLLSYLGFTLSISAALTVSSLFWLRHREGPGAVPVPGYPWVPGVFVITTLSFAFIAALRRPVEPIAGLLTIMIGIIVWVFIHRSRRRSQDGPVRASGASRRRD